MVGGAYILLQGEGERRGGGAGRFAGHCLCYPAEKLGGTHFLSLWQPLSGLCVPVPCPMSQRISGLSWERSSGPGEGGSPSQGVRKQEGCGCTERNSFLCLGDEAPDAVEFHWEFHHLL